jgi:hypothetical protein
MPTHPPRRARRRDAERARQVTGDFAGALGIEAPSVWLRRDTKLPYTSYRHGRLGITVPRRDARHAPDEQFAAKLAHELAHIYYRDIPPPTIWARLLATLAVVLVFVCGFVGATLGQAAATAAHTPDWTATLARGIGGAAGVLAGFVAGTTLMRLRDRHHGVDRWITEIRADLTATRLAGRDAVTAALRAHINADAPAWRRSPRAAGDRLASTLLRTHPPTAMRIAAVASYDMSEDPDTAARTAKMAGRAKQAWAGR